MSRDEGDRRGAGESGDFDTGYPNAADAEEELTPEEVMAFQQLPREAEPSRLLEERVVTALRREGVLRAPEVGRGSLEEAGTPAPWLRPWMLAASMAASVVLFASGVFLGHGMATRSTAQTFLAVREQDATQLALTIQEAGSAYVSALVALGELTQAGSAGGADGEPESGSTLSAARSQGSEVALASLYAAAYELARLNPGDADVLRVLRIMEEIRSRGERSSEEPQNVIWF